MIHLIFILKTHTVKEENIRDTPSQLPSHCCAGKSCMTLLTMARYEWFEEWEGTKLGKRGQNYLDLKNSMAQELLDWALKVFPQLKDKVCLHDCN